MVKAINQAVGNFKANTDKSNPAALAAAPAAIYEVCAAGLVGSACQYHVCRAIGLQDGMHAFMHSCQTS